MPINDSEMAPPSNWTMIQNIVSNIKLFLSGILANHLISFQPEKYGKTQLR